MWRSLGMLSYGVPCYSGWQGKLLHPLLHQGSLLHLDDDEGNLLHPNHRHAQVPVVPLPNLQAKKLRFKTHRQRSHQRGIFPNLPTTKKFPSRLPTKKSLLEPNKDWSPLKIPQILCGWLRMNVSFGELSKARSIQYQNLKQAKVDHLKELASTCEFRSQMIACKWNLSAGWMCCSVLAVLAVLEVLEVLEVEVLLIAGRGAAPLVSSHDSSVSQNHFGATKTKIHKYTKTLKHTKTTKEKTQIRASCQLARFLCQPESLWSAYR